MSTRGDGLPSSQREELSITRRNINVRSYGVIKVIMGNRIVDTLPLRLRCECSISICEEIIEITLAKRRELRRSYARGFIVTHAHMESTGRIIVYRAGKYCVVEKPEFTQLVVDL